MPQEEEDNDAGTSVPAPPTTPTIQLMPGGGAVGGDPHEENLARIVTYLKNYYAREAEESQRGVETMQPPDILGLAQCFHVDMYRLVRQRRVMAGLEVSSFTSGGDPPPYTNVLMSPAHTGVATAPGGVPPSPPSSVQVIEAKVPPLQRPFSGSHSSSSFTGASLTPASTPPRVTTISPPGHSGFLSQQHALQPHTSYTAAPPLVQTTNLFHGNASLEVQAAQALAGSPSPPYRPSGSGGGADAFGNATPTIFATYPPREGPPPPWAEAVRREQAQWSETPTQLPPQQIAMTIAAGEASQLSTSPRAAPRKTVTIVEQPTAVVRGSSFSSNSETFPPPPTEPISNIVKQPLKILMPIMRTGATFIKHVSSSRDPHLRFFKIQDCLDTFREKEVLMPHLTWMAPGTSPDKIEAGCALNLVHLQAVHLGAGRGTGDPHYRLFKRRRGYVVDHKGQRVANGMCAVFVFTSRPVAVCFLTEEDRQVWVGGMMAVVERNRTLQL